ATYCASDKPHDKMEMHREEVIGCKHLMTWRLTAAGRHVSLRWPSRPTESGASRTRLVGRHRSPSVRAIKSTRSTVTRSTARAPRARDGTKLGREWPLPLKPMRNRSSRNV